MIRRLIPPALTVGVLAALPARLLAHPGHDHAYATPFHELLGAAPALGVLAALTAAALGVALVASRRG
ncbi:MAG: hypothetical protein ABFS34_13610 [Gemmatimonadota bacterium]